MHSEHLAEQQAGPEPCLREGVLRGHRRGGNLMQEVAAASEQAWQQRAVCISGKKGECDLLHFV